MGALVAWKLPMRRSLRGEQEAWGSYQGYHGHHYAYPLVRERESNYASLRTDDTRFELLANGAASSDGARDIPGNSFEIHRGFIAACFTAIRGGD